MDLSYHYSDSSSEDAGYPSSMSGDDNGIPPPHAPPQSKQQQQQSRSSKRVAFRRGAPLASISSATVSSQVPVRAFQVVVAGDTNVGKTCLVLRYTSNTHTQTHISTIGIDFQSKDVRVDGMKHRVHVWDTAGQERFRTIGASYYRRADCIIIVFDVSSMSSIDALDSWLSEAMRAAQPHTFIAIAGNKCDVPEHRRAVSEEEARYAVARANETWMGYHGNQQVVPRILYLEVSARTGERVDTLFTAIIRQLVVQQREHPYAYAAAAERIGGLDRIKAQKRSSDCKC